MDIYFETKGVTVYIKWITCTSEMKAMILKTKGLFATLLTNSWSKFYKCLFVCE